MGQRAHFLMLLALGYGLAGCSTASYISPNDPLYARSGAPRTGEPPLPAGEGYRPLQGTDGGGNAPT